MWAHVKAWAADESGATAIEYGLIVSLIGVVLIVPLQELGQTISDLLNGVTSAIDQIAFKLR
jgi:pilus assembly protein Flp/PilA